MAVNDQTKKDTARAASRLLESRPSGVAPNVPELNSASSLNLASNDMNASREDPFYKFDLVSNESNESTDWGVHDSNAALLAPEPDSFPAIICVNGEAFHATIQGSIGGRVQ